MNKKERELKKKRDYYKTEKHYSWRKAYRAKNKKYIHDQQKAYRLRHDVELKLAASVKRKEMNMAILKKLGNKCICCGVKEWWNLTIDHIIPISKLKETRLNTYDLYSKILNGSISRRNLQILCYGCNSSKAAGLKCGLRHRGGI
tara:strand:+ start:45 stop:479 length:435 start_codon:yes stop_codon:yes gene_type:complete